MRNLFVLAAVVLLAVAWSAQPAAAAPEFIGVDKCTKCHKKAKEGEQLKFWKKAKHSKAFEVLGTDKAKKAAQKVGVSGDPQKNEACLVCHTTGFGEPADRFDKKFDVKDGVQCEGCHGAGGDYKKKKTMQQISKERGKDRKGVSATAKKVGLVIPDENNCKVCHSEQITFKGKTYKNPSYKDFDFKKRMEKIKHHIPDEQRAKHM